MINKIRNASLRTKMIGAASAVLLAVAALIIVLPGESIQARLNAANPGDVIQVQAGTYNERLTLSKTGITLEAIGKVTIKQVYIPGHSNTVRGFTVTDKDANNGFQVDGNGNLIENNEIFHTKQDGIWFFGHDNVFRDNYIHDILDASVADQYPGYDEHADCFQSWDWSWDTYNVLFEGNICDHNRDEGSNQIVMISGSRANTITFRNNRFIMRDAGYSPLALYGGTGYVIENNYFCNSTGQGNPAIYLAGGSNVTLTNNTWIGFNALVQGSGVVSQTGTVKGNLPCVVGAVTATPTTGVSTATGTFIAATSTRTPTINPTITRKPTSTRVPTRTRTPTPTRTATPAATGECEFGESESYVFEICKK